MIKPSAKESTFMIKARAIPGIQLAALQNLQKLPTEKKSLSKMLTAADHREGR